MPHFPMKSAQLALVLGLIACSTEGSVTNLRPNQVYSLIVPDSIILTAIGDSARVTAEVRDAGGTLVPGVTVTWSALDPSIATVSPTGTVKARGRGKGRLVATAGTQADTAQAIVAPTPASLTVTPASVQLTALGDTVALTATARDRNGNALTGVALQWSVTNTTIASVDNMGRVVARALGSTLVIAAACCGVADTTGVQVTQAIAAVRISPATATVAVGGTTQLSASAVDSRGNAISGAALSWASSNPQVAGVSAAGLVSGVAAGNATISATAGGQTGSAAVTVGSTTGSASEPVYDPTVDTVVYADNMEGYSSINTMGTVDAGKASIVPWPSPITSGVWGSNGSYAIVTGRGGTGQALRIINSGTYQSGGNFILWHAPTTADQAHHYFQYWARVTMSTPLAGGPAVKWFEVWHPSPISGNRIQWNTHDHLPCPVNSHPTYWQVYDLAQTTCQANQPIGPYFPDVADGQWHRFTFEFKPNSGVGTRDGIARMWVDGTKIIDISASAVGVTPPGGEKPWCSYDDLDAIATHGVTSTPGDKAILWGGTQTTTTPAWTYDIDDFRWWTR